VTAIATWWMAGAIWRLSQRMQRTRPEGAFAINAGMAVVGTVVEADNGASRGVGDT